MASTEQTPSISELAVEIWNNLSETFQLLMRICDHIVGESSTPVNSAEFKCLLDVLKANRNKSEEILHVVDQLAAVLGVGC